MITALALTLALATPVSSPLPACTYVITLGGRPTSALELALRATLDSVPDPHHVKRVNPDTLRQWRYVSRWDTATVFGQVFELGDVGGTADRSPLLGHKRVVLVWWTYGMNCARMPPNPAVRKDVANLFLVARRSGTRGNGASGDGAVAGLRPDSLWIGGMPTIDVGVTATQYSPDEQRPTNWPREMYGSLSLPDFREYYSLLPLAGSSDEEVLASRRRLLAWGDADPIRWTLYPAIGALCFASANVEGSATRADRCRR